MKIQTHLKIKSLNKQLRSHWSMRGKEKKAWLDALWAATVKYKIKIYRNLEIVSHRKRLLDVDNLIGGAKCCVDAIKELGFIEDDNPKVVKITYDQIQSKDEKTELIFY